MTSLSTAPGNRLPFLASPAVGGTNTGTSGHIRFPRGAVNRNTFHGGQARRHHMFNGPNASPGMQDSMERNRNSMSFFGKLSSKFQRRLVETKLCFMINHVVRLWLLVFFYFYEAWGYFPSFSSEKNEMALFNLAKCYSFANHILHCSNAEILYVRRWLIHTKFQTISIISFQLIFLWKYNSAFLNAFIWFHHVMVHRDRSINAF